MLQETTIPVTAEASLAYLAHNYANYTLWANKTLINWLRTKPLEILEKEVPSSFPSIKLTIVHIWQTQSYWYSVINKDYHYEHKEFTGSLEEAFEAFLKQSEEMAAFIATMNAGSIQAKTLVVNPWFESNFENFEYIIQCMNHSTYHRGQIVTIGRNLGFTDAPMTDYNFYNVRGK